jgi:hypothetical protein
MNNSVSYKSNDLSYRIKKYANKLNNTDDLNKINIYQAKLRKYHQLRIYEYKYEGGYNYNKISLDSGKNSIQANQ